MSLDDWHNMQCMVLIKCNRDDTISAIGYLYCTDVITGYPYRTRTQSYSMLYTPGTHFVYTHTFESGYCVLPLHAVIAA